MSKRRIEEVSGRVRAFYEGCSFPGYEEFQSPYDLIEKSEKGGYARVLHEQLPLGVRILDAGCGTGQLGIFLSMMNRQVLGVDFSFASLQKGNAFKTHFSLRNVRFCQMDLFQPALKDEMFDYVFCNGVLHHTADAYRGFQNLCGVVKKGGFVVIGLYNTYGRLLLDLRRAVFRLTHRALWLDFFIRKDTMSGDKKRVWFRDQYEHPHEDTFSVDDVLEWFRREGIDYVNAVPAIIPGDRTSVNGQLFQRHEVGTSLEHLLCQLGWIFTQSREGGFFIMIGQKP
jgi:SAM-dependent methyltransferase